MNDPFGDGHGQKPAQTTSGPYSLPGPRTPIRSHGFLQNQTPPRDPFASITSPHNLRVLLAESELMKKTIQKDLALAQEEIKLRDDRISKLQAQIQALHARISQQEVTIRNQSKTIQSPRTLRVRRAINGPLAVQTAVTQPWLTPPQTANAFMHTAQPLVLRPAQTPTANLQQVLSHGHPMLVQQQNQGAMSHYMNHKTVTHTPGQRGLEGPIVGTNLTGIFESMQSISPTRSAPSQQASITSGSRLSGEVASKFQGSPYLGVEFETKATDFGNCFRSLWAKTEQFAQTYGMNFKELNPQLLDPYLKDHMMLDSDVDIAMEYLNHEVIRPLYVAKVINFYLCKRILKYTEIVRGFDSGADAEIANLKRMIMHGQYYFPPKHKSRIDMTVDRYSSRR
jgi:hypothetical protein